MECTEAKPVESDWKEEVKSNESYEDYKIEFFDVVSEFKDM